MIRSPNLSRNHGYGFHARRANSIDISQGSFILNGKGGLLGEHGIRTVDSVNCENSGLVCIDIPTSEHNAARRQQCLDRWRYQSHHTHAVHLSLQWPSGQLDSVGELRHVLRLRSRQHGRQGTVARCPVGTGGGVGWDRPTATMSPSDVSMLTSSEIDIPSPGKMSLQTPPCNESFNRRVQIRDAYDQKMNRATTQSLDKERGLRPTRPRLSNKT